MLRTICLLLIFCEAALFASTNESYLTFINEKEPSAIFDGCVNVITGNFVIDDEIIADGIEPIKLKRSYFSLNNKDPILV